MPGINELTLTVNVEGADEAVALIQSIRENPVVLALLADLRQTEYRGVALRGDGKEPTTWTMAKFSEIKTDASMVVDSEGVVEVQVFDANGEMVYSVSRAP